MRQSSSQGAALALAAKTAEVMRTVTGQWGPCADVRRSPRQGAALVVAAKARNVMKVYHVFADPGGKIEQKTLQAMGMATTDQWGPCEARFSMKVKWKVVPWVDGPDKTGSNGVSAGDLGVKPGEDESVGRRGALQPELQKLELDSNRPHIDAERKYRKHRRIPKR